MAAVRALAWAVDLLVVIELLWLGWRALTTPDLFKAIVLFIAFGLVMAIAWVRLAAPDVALAEAAIGAGVTGALLLAALPRLPAEVLDDVVNPPPSMPWRARLLPALLMIGVAAGLVGTVFSLPEGGPDLRGAVAAKLAASGVSNPVTAVLLNFRGYDTLLELVVLLLALLGTWSLEQTALRRKAPPGQVLDLLSRSLPPVLILVAGYLLWVGAYAPGGAFQAGSVLGSAGVLLLLSGWRLPARLTGVPLRSVLVVGAGAFVLTALVLRLLTGRLLEYPPHLAGALILGLETTATLSIGATLAALFLGGAPDREKGG